MRAADLRHLIAICFLAHSAIGMAAEAPPCGPNAPPPPSAQDLASQDDAQLRSYLRDSVLSVEPIFDSGGETKVVIRAFDRLHRLVTGHRSRRYSGDQAARRFGAFELALAQSEFQLDPCTSSTVDGMRMVVAEMVRRQMQPADDGQEDSDD